MTPKAADAASKKDFAEKWFLRKVNKDADGKFNKDYTMSMWVHRNENLIL